MAIKIDYRQTKDNRVAPAIATGVGVTKSNWQNNSFVEPGARQPNRQSADVSRGCFCKSELCEYVCSFNDRDNMQHTHMLSSGLLRLCQGRGICPGKIMSNTVSLETKKVHPWFGRVWMQSKWGSWFNELGMNLW